MVQWIKCYKTIHKKHHTAIVNLKSQLSEILFCLLGQGGLIYDWSEGTFLLSGAMNFSKFFDYLILYKYIFQKIHFTYKFILVIVLIN